MTIKNTREVRRGCNYAAFADLPPQAATTGSSSSTTAQPDEALAKPDAAAAAAGGCSGRGGSCGGRKAGSGGPNGAVAQEQMVLQSTTEGAHLTGAVLAA